MTTGDTWTLRHRPALDGLRGLAIILVMAHHTYLLPVFGFGSTGVTMFFTLSGFLITALILEERENLGRLDLRRFYGRRARRLLPALLAFVVISVVVARFRGDPSWHWTDAAFVAAYVGNWAIIAGHHLWGFHHTWSLAVEEQFYLLWPVLVIAVGRCRRVFAWLMVAGVVSAVVLRFALWDNGAGYVRVYYGLDTRADALLVGCLLAYWMKSRPERAESRPLVATTACVGLVSLVVLAGNVPLLYAVVLPTLVPPLTALVIWAVASGTRGGTWLSWRPLRLVGRRAYALYLWHYFCLALAWQLPLPGAVQAVLGLALAWVLATVSWHVVERPFLRRRTPLAESQPSANLVTA